MNGCKIHAEMKLLEPISGLNRAQTMQKTAKMRLLIY